MNDNEIRDAFEKRTEPVHPERVEERVRRRMTAGTAKKRPRFPRTVLAAACILAVTAVSAGAYMVHRNLTIYPHEDGHGPYLMMVHAGEDDLKFPLLSEDIIEQIEDRCVKGEEESKDDFYERRIKFSSWEEAEEWLGCDLLTSDLLGGELVQNTIWGADILVEPVVFDEFWYVQLEGTNLVANEEEHMLCYTKITIPVSETFLDMLRTGLYGKSGYLYGGEPEGEPEVMSYRAENGLDAEIAGMYKRYGEHVFDPLVYNVNAFVIHEGILYDITIWEKDRNFTIETMHDILDSLH